MVSKPWLHYLSTIKIHLLVRLLFFNLFVSLLTPCIHLEYTTITTAKWIIMHCSTKFVKYYLTSVHSLHSHCILCCKFLFIFVVADIEEHKGPPVFTEKERYKMVRAIKWVDEVFGLIACLLMFSVFTDVKYHTWWCTCGACCGKYVCPSVIFMNCVQIAIISPDFSYCASVENRH